MILLTEEEIKVALDSQFGTDRERFGFVAKAQLKKVVERLGVCLCGCNTDEDGLTYRIPFRVWQAILEEVK